MPGWSAEQNRIRLRKERESTIDSMEKKLKDLNKECTKASAAVKKARENYETMKGSVEVLENEKVDFDKEIRAMEESEMDTTEYDPFGNLLDAAQADLEEIREELKSKREEVKDLRERFENVEDSYDRPAKVTRQSVMPDRERDVAERNLNQAESEVASLETREEIALEKVHEYTKKREAALSANQDAERESQKVAKTREALEKKKVKIEKDLQTKISLRHQLQNDLESAMKEEEEIKKRKEDFENDKKEKEKVDSDQHMDVLFEVQGSLSPCEENSLKCLLREYKVITKKQGEQIEHFVDLWEHMERTKFIEIGNYDQLRTRLLERLKLTALVKKIEQMEDDLLKQYENGATPIQRYDSQHDGETKRLNTLSQNIEKNVAGEAYNKPGGPFGFLQDVLVVIKLYLHQLEHKSDSSKALYSFVDGKLKYDILALEASNVREFESKENEILQLRQLIRGDTADKERLERRVKELELQNEENNKSWLSKLTSAITQTTSEKERFEKELGEKKAELENNRHTWEVSQRKLNDAYIVLKAEKETIAGECDKQRAIMDGNFRGQEGRFEQRVRENERICEEKVQHFRSKMHEMQKTLETLLSEQQKKNEINIAGMQQIIDDYRERLDKAEENRKKGESILRTEFQNKIRELENSHWDALVTWQTERSQLKHDLVEANVKLVLKGQDV